MKHQISVTDYDYYRIEDQSKKLGLNNKAATLRWIISYYFKKVESKE